MAEVIDARGRSCPEPVLLTKKAVATKQDSYEVLVDSRTAMQNVTRFATSVGYKVDVTQQDDDYRLVLRAEG
ncbi:sulfurtransferase TusA family protein [Ruminococcaceae bacterium OttesenSCG-928-I18]|nr:sulfurtransferase TusA family protein [Ruminococcaceae bacterium OttesenSCG-928-I18]